MVRRVRLKCCFRRVRFGGPKKLGPGLSSCGFRIGVGGTGNLPTMDSSSKQDLAELLFLALYQDNHLSLEEDSMLQTALDALGWEPSEKTGPSVNKAFAAVREAHSSDEKKEAFFTERAARLKAGGHGSIALEWLGKVLASDGFEGGEAQFLLRAKRLLF